MDTEIKKSFSGEDGTVGFVSAWESENPDVGKGEQKIVAITDNHRIDYELHFIEPFEANDKAFFTFDNLSPVKTLVTWGISGEMKYPMNLMNLFVDMDSKLGNDLDDGLRVLKDILENE